VNYFATVKLALSEQACYDIMTTAIEGGSAYWMNDGYFVHVARAPDLSITEITIRGAKDEEPVKREIIGAREIADAITLMFTAGLVNEHISRDLIQSTNDEGCGCDADTADTIVQIACFDEVVYG
jgi:hypothetical protein